MHGRVRCLGVLPGREAAAQNEVLRMFLAANSFRPTRKTFSPRPCATFSDNGKAP
jgi:hypothetical protein